MTRTEQRVEATLRSWSTVPDARGVLDRSGVVVARVVCRQWVEVFGAATAEQSYSHDPEVQRLIREEAGSLKAPEPVQSGAEPVVEV